MSPGKTSCLLAALLAGAAMPAAAQFAAHAMPARFELRAKPGEVVREVLQLGTSGQSPAEYMIRTADWKLTPDGGVDFRLDSLEQDSCRPWVRLERHQIRLAPGINRRFRFEVHVPPDAPAGLCRFAMMVESAPEAASVLPLGNIRMPVMGRLGIVVYVRVGDAKPDIAFERVEMRPSGGARQPVAVFTNRGNAHGRVEGFLAARDSAGRDIEFGVSTLPILPGETRALPLSPQDEGTGKPPVPTYPLRLKGTLDWEGGKQEIDVELR
jgi:hypothetical protein